MPAKQDSLAPGDYPLTTFNTSSGDSALMSAEGSGMRSSWASRGPYGADALYRSGSELFEDVQEDQALLGQEVIVQSLPIAILTTGSTHSISRRVNAE